MGDPSCFWIVSIASITRSRRIHDSAIACSVPKPPTQAPLKQIAAIGSSATLQPFATTCPFGADRTRRADLNDGLPRLPLERAMHNRAQGPPPRSPAR